MKKVANFLEIWMQEVSLNFWPLKNHKILWKITQIVVAVTRTLPELVCQPRNIFFSFTVWFIGSSFFTLIEFVHFICLAKIVWKYLNCSCLNLTSCLFNVQSICSSYKYETIKFSSRILVETQANDVQFPYAKCVKCKITTLNFSPSLNGYHNEMPNNQTI